MREVQVYRVSRSWKKDKKFVVELPTGKHVHFGAVGYSDYTLHKDQDRWMRYVNRHRRFEDWTKKGIDTAGFWSRWLLWNLPSLIASKKNTETRFNIKIIISR